MAGAIDTGVTEDFDGVAHPELQLGLTSVHTSTWHKE